MDTPGACRAERLEALFSRTHAGIEPGLDLTRSLLDLLGSPENSFLTVHVAGTNGKGSVCAIVETILRAMGLRTGRFTSPHLVRLNERFCIDGEPIDDAALFDLLERVEGVGEDLPRLPTFFESCTAVAFKAFAEAGVQVAVVETGLGGRWDSTNVVTPLVSVITPVGLDHMDLLGDSLEAIAKEKAGIIKEGRPVVVGTQTDEVHAVLNSVADERNAPLILARERVGVDRMRQSLTGQTLKLSTHESDYGRFEFPLSGDAQLEALTTAIATVLEVTSVLPFELSQEHLQVGFSFLDWPARFQLLEDDPPVILDVAHNPVGARMLHKQLQTHFGRGTRGTWIFSAMADKDIGGVIDALLPIAASVYTVRLTTPRAADPERLAKQIRVRGRPAEVCSLEAALDQARNLARADESFVIIAGSVYLAGEVLALNTKQAPNPSRTGEGATPDRGELV